MGVSPHRRAANHVMVSARGDVGSYTSEVLSALGRSRRVQLTVTHFIVALAAIAETDLIGTIPVSVVGTYGRRFGLATAPLPFDQGDPSFVHLVASRRSDRRWPGLVDGHYRASGAR